MLKTLKSLALAGLAGLIFSACNDTGAPDRKVIKISSSKKYEASLFRQNCAICHGPEGHGKTINGQLVPSLRYGEPANRTEEDLYTQIAVGKLPMPGFRNQLTESEMRRMAKFIKEDLQGRRSDK